MHMILAGLSLGLMYSQHKRNTSSTNANILFQGCTCLTSTAEYSLFPTYCNDTVQLSKHYYCTRGSVLIQANELN